jgi:peptidylprolyl isomerase
MIAISRRLFGALAIAAATVFAAPAWAQTPAGKPHLILTLPKGDVDIELLPELAPGHVERIITLTNQGFYNGLKFHRVIDGFMAQTGDPKGDGTGGSDLPDLKAEFTTSVSFQRGVLGMARAQDPDSASSQFFITYADASFLDGQYTVFGKVVSGMEAVDALKKGTDQSGVVDGPDSIIAAKIEYK